MKFELLYTPLLETEHGHADGRSQNQADLMNDIENFLPSIDAPLEIVATQTVAIKRASSGLHEYIPVRQCDMRVHTYLVQSFILSATYKP